MYLTLYFVFCHSVYQCYCKGLSEIMIYKSKIKRYKWIRLGFGLWYLTPLSTIFQLYHGDQCIGGGKWSICRNSKKPHTCRKSPTNFITQFCIKHTSPWARFELTTTIRSQPQRPQGINGQFKFNSIGKIPGIKGQFKVSSLTWFIRYFIELLLNFTVAK